MSNGVDSNGRREVVLSSVGKQDQETRLSKEPISQEKVLQQQVEQTAADSTRNTTHTMRAVCALTEAKMTKESSMMSDDTKVTLKPVGYGTSSVVTSNPSSLRSILRRSPDDVSCSSNHPATSTSTQAQKSVAQEEGSRTARHVRFQDDGTAVEGTAEGVRRVSAERVESRTDATPTGDAVLEKKHKEKSDLRQIEVRVNQAGRRKSDLATLAEEYME